MVARSDSATLTEIEDEPVGPGCRSSFQMLAEAWMNVLHVSVHGCGKLPLTFPFRKELAVERPSHREPNPLGHRLSQKPIHVSIVDDLLRLAEMIPQPIQQKLDVC